VRKARIYHDMLNFDQYINHIRSSKDWQTFTVPITLMTLKKNPWCISLRLLIKSF